MAAFSKLIGKSLSRDLSSWPVAANFKSIPNLRLEKLPESVIADLIADQHYVYTICPAAIDRVVDSVLQFLKVVPIVHSQWLTLGCCILRYYILVDELSSNIESLANFCLKVYFSSLLEI